MSCSNLPTSRDYPVIDAHCHVFNASDLSVSGFLRLVIINTDEGGLIEILDPLVAFLASLVRSAPSAEKEHRWLDEHISIQNEFLHNPRIIALERDLEAEELENDEFVSSVENAVEKLTLSTAPDDQALLNHILEDKGDEDIHLETLTLNFDGTRKITTRLLRGVGDVGRYVRWVRLLKRYRWQILAKLMKTYSEDHGCVDLFTPALVDFQYWLSDPPKTRLQSQYELMSRISRLVAPRMHPLAAFDPWRESLFPGGDDGSLKWVQLAVLEWGFIGVKLYPPMGFAPLGNDELDFTRIGQSDSKKFGERLDEIMRSFFQWTVEHDVPIMAHAGDSNESKKDFGKRAGPEFWEKALKEFPTLKVNLAHFGGHEELENPKGWPAQFIKLMNDYENVYADLGHFESILSDEDAESILESLGNLILDNPILKERLMFGTDWSMIARLKNADNYFEKMLEGLASRFNDDVIGNIMGRNATKFFGLGGYGKNTDRLRIFYDRHRIPRPHWL